MSFSDEAKSEIRPETGEEKARRLSREKVSSRNNKKHKSPGSLVSLRNNKEIECGRHEVKKEMKPYPHRVLQELWLLF